MPFSVTSSVRKARRKQFSTNNYRLLKALKRYLSAWSRHHRSGGFGIHSPFAYQFVCNVWRQRLPYYAYTDISQLLDTIKSSASREQRDKMDLISEKETRLLFRVTNFFNPQRLLQVGAATGVETVAMLAVNSTSLLYLYDPQLEHNALAVRVLQSRLGRVACYDDIDVATKDLLDSAEVSIMALVNTPVDETVLTRLLDARCVIVMRNMRQDEEMSRLFSSCCQHMNAGQTYTNDKIAILNPNPKLQREDFSLWL